MIRARTLLAAVALAMSMAMAFAAPAQERAPAPTSASAPDSEPDSTTRASEPRAPGAPETVFVPTETISADTAVAFPVDI